MYDIEKHSTGCRYTIYIYTYEYINSLRKQMSIVMCSYVFIWDVFFEPVAGSLKKSCFAGSTQCPCSVDNQLRFKLRKVFRLKFMKDLRLMVKGLATWHVRDWVSWLAPTAEPRLTWYKKVSQAVHEHWTTIRSVQTIPREALGLCDEVWPLVFYKIEPFWCINLRALTGTEHRFATSSIDMKKIEYGTGWSFQTFFIFHFIYGIILPKMVKTTNQIVSKMRPCLWSRWKWWKLILPDI